MDPPRSQETGGRHDTPAKRRIRQSCAQRLGHPQRAAQVRREEHEEGAGDAENKGSGLFPVAVRLVEGNDLRGRVTNVRRVPPQTYESNYHQNKERQSCKRPKARPPRSHHVPSSLGALLRNLDGRASIARNPKQALTGTDRNKAPDRAV